MNEAQALVRMFQYYKDMYPRRSQVLSLLSEASRIPKGRSILWNDKLEVASCEIKGMLSADTLLYYLAWKIMFTVHTYVPDK